VSSLIFGHMDDYGVCFFITIFFVNYCFFARDFLNCGALPFCLAFYFLLFFKICFDLLNCIIFANLFLLLLLFYINLLFSGIEPGGS